MAPRLSLVVLLSVVAAPVTPAPPTKDADKYYFPTKVGDTLVYEVTKGKSPPEEATDVVTAVEKKDGVLVVSVTGTRGKIKMDTKTAVSDKGVFRVANAGIALASPMPQLKLPITIGESWTYDHETIPGVPPNKMKYTVAAEEKLELPAGKFTAVRVDMESEVAGAKFHESRWYAAGVGQVKQVVKYGDSEFVQLLKSRTSEK